MLAPIQPVERYSHAAVQVAGLAFTIEVVSRRGVAVVAVDRRMKDGRLRKSALKDVGGREMWKKQIGTTFVATSVVRKLPNQPLCIRPLPTSTTLATFEHESQGILSFADSVFVCAPLSWRRTRAR